MPPNQLAERGLLAPCGEALQQLGIGDCAGRRSQVAKVAQKAARDLRHGGLLESVSA
jgi:hypothetical protein